MTQRPPQVDGAESAPPAPATGLQSILTVGLEHLAAKASNKIDEWTDKLHDASTGQGTATEGAAAAAAQAPVEGKSPPWAAIKGAWSGASAKTRLVVILLTIPALLAAILMLVVGLLALLVAAIAAAIRALSR